jgi:hypothetical protein
MTNKNKQFTEAEKTCYKLGVLNERARTKRTLELLRNDNRRRWEKITIILTLLRKTNRHQWDELVRLDREDQGDIRGVVISFRQMSSLINKLKEPKGHSQLASKYEKMLEEAKMRGGCRYWI